VARKDRRHDRHFEHDARGAEPEHILPGCIDASTKMIRVVKNN
jgi:hypothetical protein